MAEITKYTYRVEPQQVDFTLRASVPSMLDCILNTAGKDAHNKGFGVEVLQRQSLSWVLSRLAVELDRVPEQYEDFSVGTWINDFNRLSSTRNFTLESRGEVFGRAVSQWCMIDMRSRSVADMSSMADAYRAVMVDAESPCGKPLRLGSIEPQHNVERPVVYSDIDFNRHVNTMRYVEMIFNALPLERIERNSGVRVDLNFLAEGRWGQTLIMGHTSEGDTSNFEISSDDGRTLCRARVEWR
ncbi:MAG: acyl-ACP thioesterase [Alistipes sp.]|nr:acyl-ACP thioesterase [Alistipes sp.]MDE7129954.1 acyl-ACP thioesterase [Alistipes sp.]